MEFFYKIWMHTLICRCKILFYSDIFILFSMLQKDIRIECVYPGFFFELFRSSKGRIILRSWINFLISDVICSWHDPYILGVSEILQQNFGGEFSRQKLEKKNKSTYPKMSNLWVIKDFNNKNRIYLQWHMTNVIYLQCNSLSTQNS